MQTLIYGKEKMTKKELQKKFGLSSENFNFYIQMKMIWKKKRKKNEWEYDNRLEYWVLEKSSVFKYCFNDNFREHMKQFRNVIKYTGPVKVYTKEEIAEYERKRRTEEEK
jgi:hypothetical protein